MKNSKKQGVKKTLIFGSFHAIKLISTDNHIIIRSVEIHRFFLKKYSLKCDFFRKFCTQKTKRTNSFMDELD
jgi:hypothetical protein